MEAFARFRWEARGAGVVPRSESSEFLDRAQLSYGETHRALGDLARVNRLLLGWLPVRRTLLARVLANDGPQLLLDLGTGLGDVGERLTRWVERRGRRLTVVGLDRQLRHLLISRACGVRQRRVVGDARALPFHNGAVDWALSTLFFHHLGDEGNRQVLLEMRRVALRAAVVVDLRRSAWTLWWARLLLAVVGVGRVARHDGKVSVRRSSTLDEVADLVAGGPVEELRRRFPCRFSLVLRGGGPYPGGPALPPPTSVRATCLAGEQVFP